MKNHTKKNKTFRGMIFCRPMIRRLCLGWLHLGDLSNSNLGIDYQYMNQEVSPIQYRVVDTWFFHPGEGLFKYYVIFRFFLWPLPSPWNQLLSLKRPPSFSNGSIVKIGPFKAIFILGILLEHSKNNFVNDIEHYNCNGFNCRGFFKTPSYNPNPPQKIVISCKILA